MIRVRALVKGRWLVGEVVGCHEGKIICYIMDRGVEQYVAVEHYRSIHSTDRSLP